MHATDLNKLANVDKAVAVQVKHLKGELKLPRRGREGGDQEEKLIVGNEAAALAIREVSWMHQRQVDNSGQPAAGRRRAWPSDGAGIPAAS